MLMMRSSYSRLPAIESPTLELTDPSSGGAADAKFVPNDDAPSQQARTAEAELYSHDTEQGGGFPPSQQLSGKTSRRVRACCTPGICVTLCLLVILGGMVILSPSVIAAHFKPVTPASNYASCLGSPDSNFFTALCFFRTDYSVPNVAAVLAPSLLTGPFPRILVTTQSTYGSERNDQTQDIFHLSTTRTPYNLFTLVAYSNSVYLMRVPLSTVISDRDFSVLTTLSALGNLVCILDSVWIGETRLLSLDNLLAAVVSLVDSPGGKVSLEGAQLYSSSILLKLVVTRGTPDQPVLSRLSLSLLLLAPPSQPAREASPLVGYFTTAFTLLDTPATLASRRDRTLRLVNRRVSNFDFVLDPSIPAHLHAACASGVLAWNDAFERIGRGRPLRVLDPPPPDYDGASAHFSSISWSLSTELTFAVAPNVVDPQTGEIISTAIVVAASWPAYWELEEQTSPRRCLQRAMLSPSLEADAVEALVMHEVGHALGLRHNFKGSAGLTFANLASARAGCVGSSVMDYLPRNPRSRIHPYSTGIGEYDFAAIAYAYSTLEAPLTLELVPSGLQQHAVVLELKDTPELARLALQAGPFATDEDDPSPSGQDPFANDFDLSSEPLLFWAATMEYCASVVASPPIDVPVNEWMPTVLAQVRRSVLYTLKFVGGRVGPQQQQPAPRQKEALEMALEVTLNGSFRGTPLMPAQGFSVPAGDCSGVDQHCYASKFYSAAKLLQGLQTRVMGSLFAPARLDRLACQSDSWGLRQTLDLVFDKVWGPKTQPRTDVADFEPQRIWVDAVVNATNSTELSSLSRAMLKQDCSKLLDVFRNEWNFESSLVRGHWGLVKGMLARAGLGD